MAHTYLDASTDATCLTPAGQPELVFAAYIDKGPGFSEEVQWLYGPSKDGELFVLWIESDWMEDPEFARSPIAWVARGEELGEPAWVHLLRAYWQAEKKHNWWEEPNFSEIIASKKSLMSPKQVQQLAYSIWQPEGNDG